MEVEHITAPEFLAVAQNAERNASGKPAFRKTLELLEGLPRTQERLVFELLLAARQRVEAGLDPGGCLLWVRAWSSSIRDQRIPDYLETLKEITLQYFHMLGRLDIEQGTVHPYAMTLALGLTAISKRDEHQSRLTLRALRAACAATERDPRSNIVSKLEKLMLNG